MRKTLNQIICEATAKLPDSKQITGDYWSINIGDGNGGIVTVTFVKYCRGWNLYSTNY